MREIATSVENAGRIVLLVDENDRVKIRFEKMNLEVKDLMIVKALELFRDVVVAAHGVPSRILGIVTLSQLGASPYTALLKSPYLAQGGPSANAQGKVLRPGKRLLETAQGTLLEGKRPVNYLLLFFQ